MSQSAAGQEPTHGSGSTASKTPGGFGPNEWLVDELYQQYLADKNSVDQAWWDFFKDYRPAESGPATDQRQQHTGRAARPPPRQRPPPTRPAPPAPTAPVADGDACGPAGRPEARGRPGEPAGRGEGRHAARRRSGDRCG